MLIKVKGSQEFSHLVGEFHKTLWSLAIKSFPEFKSLSSITLTVQETSTLPDLGLSRLDYKEILINEQLTKTNPKLLLEVYGHELAHCLITYHLGRNVQHGTEWQKVMLALNLPPRECITFSSQDMNKNQMITVKCKCYFNSTKTLHQSQWNNTKVCPRCHNKFTVL